MPAISFLFALINFVVQHAHKLFKRIRQKEFVKKNYEKRNSDKKEPVAKGSC